MKRFYRACVASIFLGCLILNPVQASFMEQILVHTKAISLGNSVTANPPGHMAIHYNPAGLSQLEDGIVVGQGFALVRLERTYKFKPDLTYNDKFDPKEDPVSYEKGAVRNGRIYIPFAGGINLPVLAAPVPSGMSYRKPCSKWTFANGIYAPFAGGFEHSHEEPERFQGEAVYLQHLMYASPSVSYQVNDQLALGLSLGMGQTAMGALTDVRAPAIVDLTNLLRDLGSRGVKGIPPFNVNIGIFERVADLEFDVRDDFTPSFNFGVLYQPNHWLTLGAVYQSPIKVDLVGRYRFRYSDKLMEMLDWLNTQTGMSDETWDRSHVNKQFESGRLDMVGFEFPQRVQLGVMVKPFRRLKVMMDWHWTDWTSTDAYVMQFDQNIQVVMMTQMLGYDGPAYQLIYPKHFDNPWHLSVGFEYEMHDWLTVRLGFEDRQTCAKDHLFDLFSLPDVYLYGAGLGIQWVPGLDIDLGVAYLTYNDYYVPNNTSTNLNYTGSGTPVYSPFAGQHYETSFNTYIASMNMTVTFDLLKDYIERKMISWGIY
ncbi:MAG: aromatic hydrocarbon degradation membrane protein [Candidatus Magnetoglobus multicellularis str. Araruama]|uniref:Aromatic hydrocarbon degradation membrane protein n=1 Tax=Candidatus Magnetoglobus multicellularis str. Araruama TaxID=890399 RepID=A0A1V1P6Y8_9BACT|nr:MAG: aromatic hydrocarbon degradation membrane protein [Candidatus Magnetoglobus multicellularis str. Araruama]